tara:strand:- start:5173 stop:5997 length:825 start_codon:yes stop_codon:yes gene_type:complete
MKSNYFNIAIVLFLVIGILYSTRLVKKKTIQWKHLDAVEQYNILSKKYGTPSNQDLSKGGIAIWRRDKLKDTCFELIELLDESVPHCVPKPHRDFLYTSVKYEIPDEKVPEVTSLSGSVAYDPLKKLLRARCGSEAANIATLYLAVSIGNSRISLDKVQKDKLYGKTITSTANPQNVEIYYNKLCKYLKDQPGNPNWTGFYPLAFPEGCCEGYDPENNTCGKSNKETFFGHSSDKADKSEEPFYSDKSDKSKEDFYTDKGDKSSIAKNAAPVLV